jgi:hypothetical protein
MIFGKATMGIAAIAVFTLWFGAEHGSTSTGVPKQA